MGINKNHPGKAEVSGDQPMLDIGPLCSSPNNLMMSQKKTLTQTFSAPLCSSSDANGIKQANNTSKEKHTIFSPNGGLKKLPSLKPGGISSVLSPPESCLKSPISANGSQLNISKASEAEEQNPLSIMMDFQTSDQNNTTEQR